MEDAQKTKMQLITELHRLRKRLTALEKSRPVLRPFKTPPKKTDDPYGVLAEAANDFIFVIDRHDRVVYVNRFGADQLGLPVEKIIGKPRKGLFPPGVAELQGKNLEKVFQTGKPLNVENKIVFGNREVWVNTWLVPLLRVKNRVQSILGISRDLTERRQMEKKLRRSEEYFRLTFDQSPIGSAIVGQDFLFQRVNEAFCRFIGYTAEELRSLSFSDITHPEDLDRDLPFIKIMSAGHLDYYERDKRYIRKNGEIVWGRLSVRMVKSPEGRPLYSMPMVLDITERKKAEEELQNSQKELRALSAQLQSVREEERAKIAREIHDDLGQALTGLKMDSAWVMKNLHPDQTALKNKLQAMGKLIDHTVRSVRRLSTELRPRILDDFGLVAALEWQAQEFENKTGIRCRFRSSLQRPALDPDRSVAVFRIFQEALTNVARHSGATKVESALRKEKKGLRLTIRDNGRGIAEEEISRTKSLGLVGMRERALLFGGELLIQGTPGKGTTVTLKIPA